MFEEFLDDVVAKHIFHQLDRVWLDLPEYLFLLVAVRCYQLFLYESRTVLVTTELNDVVVNILTLVSCGFWVF